MLSHSLHLRKCPLLRLLYGYFTLMKNSSSLEGSRQDRNDAGNKHMNLKLSFFVQEKKNYNSCWHQLSPTASSLCHFQPETWEYCHFWWKVLCQPDGRKIYRHVVYTKETGEAVDTFTFLLNPQVANSVPLCGLFANAVPPWGQVKLFFPHKHVHKECLVTSEEVHTCWVTIVTNGARSES